MINNIRIEPKMINLFSKEIKDEDVMEHIKINLYQINIVNVINKFLNLFKDV